MNLAIESLADKNIKPQYLSPIIVIRQLKREAFILTELNYSLQQNKVAAFKVILYLTYIKIVFGNKVRVLLDTPESSVKELEKSSVEGVSKESSLVDDLD